MYRLGLGLVDDSTYILLCDLLMDVHVTQPQAELATLSDDSTVCSSPLVAQPGDTAGVLGQTGV